MSRLQKPWPPPARSVPFLLLLGLLLFALIPAARSSAQIAPGAAAGPAALNGPAILVLTDDPVHRPPESYVDHALKNLGLLYTPVYDDMARFEEALFEGEWDLVIMANDQLEPTKAIFENLDKYVRGGGRLIIHTWVMAEVRDDPLWETLGVVWTDAVFLPPKEPARPLYWWEPDHPVFNDPNEKVPEFVEMSNTWEIEWFVEHLVDPAKGFEPLGGYQEGLAEGMAGLVIGNGGQTIFRGFVDFINEADLDEDKIPDAQELWENLIKFVLRPVAFAKSLPANNVTGVPLIARLDWGDSSGASNYGYCINQRDNSLCYDSWLYSASSGATVTGLAPNTTYYWQARAENDFGVTQANGGTWWKFTTGDQPPELIFLPALMRDLCSAFPGPREQELNDTFAMANGLICYDYPLLGDPDEHGAAKDEDWYKLYWSGQGTIKIDVTGYLQAAQVLLYYESDVGNEIARDVNQVDRHYEISYPGTGQAGIYFIRLFAPPSHPEGNGDYTLTVAIQ